MGPLTSELPADITAAIDELSAAERACNGTSMFERGVRSIAYEQARAALTAAILKHLGATPAAPEGWKLVPIEPTEAMLSVEAETDLGSMPISGYLDDFSAEEIYRAMVAAAPNPAAEEA